MNQKRKHTNDLTIIRAYGWYTVNEGAIKWTNAFIEKREETIEKEGDREREGERKRKRVEINIVSNFPLWLRAAHPGDNKWQNFW